MQERVAVLVADRESPRRMERQSGRLVAGFRRVLIIQLDLRVSLRGAGSFGTIPCSNMHIMRQRVL